jgi:hypothetical protein
MISKIIFSILLIMSVVTTFAAEPKKNQLATEEDAQKIQKSIDEIFKLYEGGSLSLFKNKFDPSIVGLQKLMDSIAIENSQCKQIRINLVNTKITVGTEVAVLQTGWEKRCLQLPNLSPKLLTGEGSFMLHKSAFGWQIAGLTGTMPFSAIKIPVTLTASTTTTCTTILGTSTIPVALPFTITVVDPNRAKQASVQVEVATGTDSELWTLSANPGSLGTFSVTTVLGHQGSGNPNNGSLQILVSSGSCSSVRVNYTSSSVADGLRTFSKSVNWL